MLFSVVPGFDPKSPKAQIPRTPVGAEGTYRITFILGIPGKQMFHEQLDFTRLLESGESLLMMPGGTPAKAELSTETEKVEIIFIPNRQSMLAKVQMRLTAPNILAARNAAGRGRQGAKDARGVSRHNTDQSSRLWRQLERYPRSWRGGRGGRRRHHDRCGGDSRDIAAGHAPVDP
jgi:hypothetical protein